MKRVVIPEWLDTDTPSPDEVQVAMADLRLINRWFGGVRTTRKMLKGTGVGSNGRRLSLLEVAAGAGYVPQTASKQLEKCGVRIDVTLLDRAPSHLNHNGNGTQAVVADALKLPFADASFDFVHCCLFVHHLLPREVVDFVNEGLRVCRTAVLINDIVRHPVHLALVYASLPLYRSYLTHHDAPASVKQAYTKPEIREMLAQTSAARVEITSFPLFRMGVIAWRGQ